MGHDISHLPFDLDTHDPKFADRMFDWAFQTQCELREIVARTEKTIATSKALIADADRLLEFAKRSFNSA